MTCTFTNVHQLDNYSAMNYVEHIMPGFNVGLTGVSTSRKMIAELEEKLEKLKSLAEIRASGNPKDKI